MKEYLDFNWSAQLSCQNDSWKVAVAVDLTQQKILDYIK